MVVLAAGVAGCEDDYSDLPLPTSLPSDRAATTPAEDEVAAAVGPAPHGGALLTLGDREGYVEWLHEPGEKKAKFHVLDTGLGPAADVTEAVLYLTSPAGPETATITTCASEGPGYCADVEASRLAEDDFHGVLRIVMGGNRFRILLDARAEGAASQPGVPGIPFAPQPASQPVP